MGSLKKLPWIEPFLDRIKTEYTKPPPSYTIVRPTYESVKYILSVADEKDAFDTAGLKAECGEALRKNKATVLQSESPLGTILVVSLDSSPLKPSWNLWWRSIRLLVPASKKVRILIFGHPKERIVPYNHQPITEVHVNGGAAMRCDPMSIVLYRKEEVSRVLMHELFHASCSDPYHLDVPQVESDTEAWAELFLCAMAAKGQMQPFIKHLKQQIAWAVKQAATVQTYYCVKSIRDYAWRYLVGRIIVWRSMGIYVPDYPNSFKPIHSLRFSIIEPKDD